MIVRTAAEGATEEELTRDVDRLTAQWEDIEQKAKSGQRARAALRRAGPDHPRGPRHLQRGLHQAAWCRATTAGTWSTSTSATWRRTCADRLEPLDGRRGRRSPTTGSTSSSPRRWTARCGCPAGGSLVIDRTEAMTVVDVNTGKFTGQGGNLEETVTRNNLEAAEEIVRQLRLRDIGGIIVIDFIDMVLESNRDLVLRRLLECLGRDRTKHQVAEVTSLGLVQMTRKRVGAGPARGLLRALRLLQRARRDHLPRPDRSPQRRPRPGRRPRGEGPPVQRRQDGKESGRRARPSRPRAATRTAVPAPTAQPRARPSPTAPGPVNRRRRCQSRRRCRRRAPSRRRSGRQRSGRRRGAAVGRAPPAPGRHPPAGPSRARQPLPDAAPAGWPSVRRAGPKRPPSGSAGAPARGAQCSGARAASEPSCFGARPGSPAPARRRQDPVEGARVQGSPAQDLAPASPRPESPPGTPVPRTPARPSLAGVARRAGRWPRRSRHAGARGLDGERQHCRRPATRAAPRRPGTRSCDGPPAASVGLSPRIV